MKQTKQQKIEVLNAQIAKMQETIKSTIEIIETIKFIIVDNKHSPITTSELIDLLRVRMNNLFKTIDSLTVELKAVKSENARLWYLSRVYCKDETLSNNTDEQANHYDQITRKQSPFTLPNF